MEKRPLTPQARAARAGQRVSAHDVHIVHNVHNVHTLQGSPHSQLTFLGSDFTKKEKPPRLRNGMLWAGRGS